MKRLPLDDPRWRPLAEVYQLRRQQTASSTLAARDITDALVQGEGKGVRCLRRKVNLRLPGPDRDLVPPEFWQGFELYVVSRGEEVVIVPRRRGGQVIPLKGLAFFLWGPDVDKAWPSSTAKTRAKTRVKTEAAPRKRGAKAPGRPKIKLTWKAIEAEIKRRRKTGKPETDKALARAFNCSPQTIARRRRSQNIKTF